MKSFSTLLDASDCAALRHFAGDGVEGPFDSLAQERYRAYNNHGDQGGDQGVFRGGNTIFSFNQFH